MRRGDPTPFSLRLVFSVTLYHIYCCLKKIRDNGPKNVLYYDMGHKCYDPRYHT